MTRFERYPGPPGGGPGLHRVISPWRDALAWVSIAGPLRVAQLLVREGDGWRAVIPPPAVLDDVDPAPLWTLDHRDPVELVFACTLPGIAGTASVTVTREGCSIHLNLRNDGDVHVVLTALVAHGAGALPPGDTSTFLIQVPAG
ncbi:MAG TPA: hypothetical protein VM450_11150 [Thermomicrobiales bacterium]|nr:hypothetical protein [Thermomicrobiales bacterium]